MYICIELLVIGTSVLVKGPIWKKEKLNLRDENLPPRTNCLTQMNFPWIALEKNQGSQEDLSFQIS